MKKTEETSLITKEKNDGKKLSETTFSFNKADFMLEGWRDREIL